MQPITKDVINDAMRQTKIKIITHFGTRILLAAAFSGTFIVIGLSIPPSIGWIPFIFGFVNLGMALRVLGKASISAWRAITRMGVELGAMVDTVGTVSPRDVIEMARRHNAEDEKREAENQ